MLFLCWTDKLNRNLALKFNINNNNPKVTFLINSSDAKNKITFNINNDEVEQYMWVSHDHLSDINNMRIRYKERSGETIEDFVYSYQEFLIWGMTGRIVNSFIKEVSVII